MAAKARMTSASRCLLLTSSLRVPWSLTCVSGEAKDKCVPVACGSRLCTPQCMGEEAGPRQSGERFFFSSLTLST